jgi:hypothetical protein
MAARRAVASVEFAQITRPHELASGLRRELVDCWVAVSNAGGAVIPHGFSLPPVCEREVGPVLDGIVQALDPQRSM